MPRVLIDTNVFLRRLDRSSPMKPVARRALTSLRSNGFELVIVPQTLYELWVVLTRPATARGGFGYSTEKASARLKAIASGYTLIPDTPAIYSEWFRLVQFYDIKGAKAHDARLVAAASVAEIASVLTFNVSDFQIFTVEGFSVLDPATF